MNLELERKLLIGNVDSGVISTTMGRENHPGITYKQIRLRNCPKEIPSSDKTRPEYPIPTLQARFDLSNHGVEGWF